MSSQDTASVTIHHARRLWRALAEFQSRGAELLLLSGAFTVPLDQETNARLHAPGSWEDKDQQMLWDRFKEQGNPFPDVPIKPRDLKVRADTSKQTTVTFGSFTAPFIPTCLSP